MSTYVYRNCIVCERLIARPFWMCRDCEREYKLVDVDYADWPDWAKELCNEVQRQERDIADQLTDSFDELAERGLQIDGLGRVTTRANPSAWIPDRSLLQFAPYDDEVSNREYRRANGIAERM